jgi:alpha-glucosidase
MRRILSIPASSLLALVLFALLPAHAQQNQAPPLIVLDHLTGFTALPNGIDLQFGPAREQITALRDDVLRIRVSPTGTLPEDASWAVLASARQSTATVTPIATDALIGFSTQALRVEIDRRTLQLTIRDANGNILQQDAQPITYTGSAFRVAKKMPLNEHYFGLGDKTGPLDRRNEAFTLWNTDAYGYQESTDPLYKSIPFVLTYRAGVSCGFLLDNTWRSNFDFGKLARDTYSYGAENGPLDSYFFYGPSPKQVVQTYAWLTGTPPLPPLWTLGYQQSRYSYEPQSRVLEVAARLRTDRIPADSIYFDIDYQQDYRPFTVNTTLFPDFSGMIATLDAENFHPVAITDLHIANYPNHGYAPYDSGVAGDHFVKNPDGSIYTGKVWPGPSVFPDFTRTPTRAWWGTLYRDFYSTGIAGFWNDMNEPSIFDSPTLTMPTDVVHRIDEPGFQTRTATHAEIHNVYGMENSRATFEGLLALNPNARPFVLTRATYAGGQRYAATWTGDNSSTWNHLRLTTPMLENLGLSGFAFSGADVGGYAGTPSTDLLTKWFEVAAFQPIDRDHTEKGSADQEPWVGGPEHEAIRRSFIETRYRLMPYLYTLAEEASRTGLPVVRPLFLEFPDAAADRHPLDVELAASAEFLLGPDLLIAPAPWPDQIEPYPIELPSSDWYDFWTGERIPHPPTAPAVQADNRPIDPAAPPLTITAHPQLATLPVFVRGGTILPIEPLVQSTNETPRGPLELRVYPGDPGKNQACGGSLYLDDGKTMAWRHGDLLRMSFTCSESAGVFHLHIGAHEGSYPAWWKQIRVELYGSTPKSAALVIDGHRQSIPLTSSAQSTAFTIDDSGKGMDVDLQ